MSHRLTLTVALALTLLAVGAFATGDEPLKVTAEYESTDLVLATPVLSVPMHAKSDFVMLEIELNGKGPYHFWMDTGASIDACIDTKLAEELGLPSIGTVQNADGSGRSEERQLVGVESIVLGGMEFSDLRAVVADYSWIDFRGVKGRGILGLSMFEDYLITLNYEKKRFELRRGELPEPGANHVAPYDGTDGVPRLKLRVGHKSAVVTLDSGFRGALGLPGVLRKATGFRGRPAEGKGQAVNGSFRTFQGTLAKPVHFAGWKWEALDGVFLEGFGHGMIGRDLMRHHVITLDPENRRVHFGLLAR